MTGVDTKLATQAALDLAALGVYDQDEAAENSFARILLLGPSKTGKTTSIATTAPEPFIINCDGDSALKYPKKKGAKFLACDALDRASWKKAQRTAKTLVDAGRAKTVVVDTVSLLGDNILDECRGKYEGFEIYGELAMAVVSGCKFLLRLPAHVVFVAHISPDFDDVSGVMPMIAGQSKAKIPALVDDWVFFDVDTDKNPPVRQFNLGVNKRWGRNIKRTISVPADFNKLCEELGINP